MEFLKIQFVINIWTFLENPWIFVNEIQLGVFPTLSILFHEFHGKSRKKNTENDRNNRFFFPKFPGTETSEMFHLVRWKSSKKTVIFGKFRPQCVPNFIEGVCHFCIWIQIYTNGILRVAKITIVMPHVLDQYFFTKGPFLGQKHL